VAKRPEPKPRAPRPPPPAEWYWQPVTADVHAPPRKPLVLPVPESAIVKNDALWNTLSPEAKEKLRATGVLVNGSESDPLPKTATSFGAFYTDLATTQPKAAQLITVDALFGVTRIGLELGLAQVEEQLAPTLDAFLARLDARLAADQKGAGATLSDAYRIARGIIAVTGTGKPAPELAATVSAERALIEAHAVTATSPLLGFPIDYTRFAVPSAAARPGAFRALAWLGSAPLPLMARAEQAGAPLDIAQARTTTRAAMLLARLCDADVDAESNALYTRIVRFLTFGWGASDDVTLFEIDQMGAKAQVDLTKPEDINDVAKVDKIRFAAMKAHAPAIYDGPGGVGRSARVFGGHASPDGVALTTLLRVGPAQEGAPPSLQRDGRRVIPTTLDIAAWLGAPGARAALHETHADAFAGFDAALTSLTEERDLDAFHSSIFDSFLVAAGALASEADAETSPPSRLESILTAWTSVRHVDQPFTRKPKPPPAQGARAESTAPILVENAPQTIARLLATVRQAKRGFEALGFGATDSPFVPLDELLKIALMAAEHRANDEPLTAADHAKVATLPARISELDDGESQQIASVVASDPPSRRVLVTANGRIEPLFELTRDIGRDEPLLVVGAHQAHHEIVTDVGDAPTDAAWRGKVATATRAAYTAGFRILPPGRVSQ
jgi:hypothetical protein